MVDYRFYKVGALASVLTVQLFMGSGEDAMKPSKMVDPVSFRDENGFPPWQNPPGVETSLMLKPIVEPIDQKTVLAQVAIDLLENAVNLPSEVQNVLDKEFWDLV
ncbi:MAG: hypothetical protein HQM09_19450 [Candidatus Riflebacteria bacterium]|nr:hypothetical protein [Candidatus Riflebacteria bacterium]